MSNLVNHLPTVAFWGVAFTFLNRHLYKNVPMPTKIARIEDTKHRAILYWEYVTNFCSIIHAIASCIWGHYIMMKYGARHAASNLDSENGLLAFSLGYFLVDSVLGYIYKYNDKVMNMHHAEAVMSLIYGLAKNRYANSMVWALWLAEMSNPFNLIRKNLEMHDGREKWATGFGLIFCVIFIYTRTYWVGYFLSQMQESSASLFIKVHGGLICNLNRAHFSVLVLRHHEQINQGIGRR
jgi:hypothetical protein